jgi:alanine racemase
VTTSRCAIGDIVTLIGRSAGTVLTAERVADDARMSPYELLTGLRSRLERVYTSTSE